MELTVDPAVGPVDVVPRIGVTGAPPGAPVELTIRVVDAAGHRWRSRAPRGDGAHPDMPSWAMNFADDDVAPMAFVAATASGSSPSPRRATTVRAC